MKYTAHLSAGGTVEMEFANLDPNVMVAQGEYHWLVDDNGVMVNMNFVAAFVPASEEQEKGEPIAIVDFEGDTWFQTEEGLYSLRGGDAENGWTRKQIEDTYGIKEERF